MRDQKLNAETYEAQRVSEPDLRDEDDDEVCSCTGEQLLAERCAELGSFGGV